MDTCLHVLMRDERRKEERSKQGQTNNKAKQHSTPKAVTFPKKNELPHVHMYMYVYLLDITKQRCCIEWFVSGLYNYVHFPVVNYIDIQQISCSAQRAAFALAGLMLSCLGTATTIYK